MENNAPVQVHILWGSTLDPDDEPSVYAFQTPEEERAFWLGVSEADGWMDLNEVSSADWRVDAEGEIVPRKVKKPTPVLPNTRYVIWGEDPERGARPSVYSFDTTGQSEAFLLGASEMVGWSSYSQVPGAGYRYIDETGRASHLSELGRLALAALSTESLDRPEPLFMEKDGAYMGEGGSPEDVVDFVPEFDKGLRTTYGVGLVDVGMDAELLGKLMRDHEGAPAEAVAWYGSKYDLDPIPTPSRPRF